MGKSLDEITDDVIEMYEKGKDVDEIARLISVPNYLVASILVQIKNIHFR